MILTKNFHSLPKVLRPTVFRKSMLPALQLSDLYTRNVGNTVSRPSLVYSVIVSSTGNPLLQL